MNKPTATTIDALYDENLVDIFDDFALKERISFRKVCLRWNRVINDTIRWRYELGLYFETTKDVYMSNVSWMYASGEIGDMRDAEVLRFAVERDLIARRLDLGRSTTVATETHQGSTIRTIDLSPGGQWLLTASKKSVTAWKTEGLTRLATRQFDHNSIISDWAWNQSEESLTVLTRPKNLPRYVPFCSLDISGVTLVGNSDLPAIAYKISLLDERSFDFVRLIEGIDQEGVHAVTLMNNGAVAVLQIDGENRLTCRRYSLTDLTTDFFLLNNNLGVNIHDMARKAVFTDSGHIAHVSATECAFWYLSHSAGEDSVTPNTLNWLDTRLIYVVKLKNLFEVSRINCSIVTNDGDHLLREIDVRMEEGRWSYSYGDTKVIVDVAERRTAGKKVFLQRVLSEEDPIRWDTVVAAIPTDGDGKTAEEIKRWPENLMVDCDVASGVFVTLSKSEGVGILQSGFVL